MERTNADWLELLEQHKTHIKYLQTDYDLEETFERDFKAVIKDSDNNFNLDHFFIPFIGISLFIHGYFLLLLFLFIGYKVKSYYKNKPIKEKQSYLKARLLKVIKHYENNRQSAFEVQKGRLEDAHNNKMKDNLKISKERIAASKSLMDNPLFTFIDEELENQENIREGYNKQKYYLISKLENDVEYLRGYYGILD